MKFFSSILVSLLTVAICVFLNGNFPLKSYIPPFGKMLFPKTGLWQNAELYTKDFEINNEMVKAPVRIIFDNRMVPHIYADNMADALFAQGYVQARDRLFQMDLSTRSAAGRLSEVVGEAGLAHDINMRGEGIWLKAKEATENWDSSTNVDLYNAYCAGINEYIESLRPREYPFEFKLLNYKPEKWSATKSALIQKLMERMLCSVSKDIQLTNLKATLPDSIYSDLYPERNPFDKPVIPAEVNYDFDPVYDDYYQELDVIDSFPKPIKFKSNKGIGSNNWAISAEKSITGHPILSNDPHLRLTLPSIWHEVHITTPDFNARGVGIPGIPGILIGFNKHIAWGTTNVGQDVKDYYQIKYTDDSGDYYEIDGQRKKVNLRTETIKVRNAVDTSLIIRETDWGPITYQSKGRKKDLAMSWLPLHRENHDDFMIFLDILDAKSYEDFTSVMNNYATPAQNFLAASKNGTIGLRVTGLFPAKQSGDGRYVKDGSFSKSGHETFIPREQLAHVKNPTSGYVTSANQQSTTEAYPYYYTSEYFENFRGRQINKLLSEKEKLGLDDMMAMQANTYNLNAQELLPFFLSALEGMTLSKEETEYVQVLKNWKYQMDADEKAATIFSAWNRKYKELTLDEIKDISTRMSVAYPSQWVINNLSNTKPNHVIFDNQETAKRETALDIARSSFKDICALGKYMQNWSEYRDFNIPHLARIDGLGSETLSVGGNGDVVNAIDYNFAPSWRMIVHLDEEPEGMGVFPGGQSGNPNSKFYKNDVDKWVNGEYNELKLSRAEDIKDAILEINLNAGK